MIFFGVLRTEKSLFPPEETVCGVLVAADVEDRRGHEIGFGDIPTRCRNRLVGTGLEIESRNVGENPLAGETTTADPLALLGHGRTPGREAEGE
jgi:hypothetical protein